MLQEKSHHSKTPEIILEIGVLQTRMGLSIDSLPRKTIKTSPAVFYPILQMIKDNKDNSNDLYRLVVKQEEFQLKMEEYLHYLFDQELAYNPKDKSVVLIYQYYSQEDIPNTIAKLLFTKFAVAKVCFLVSNVLPLYITGFFSGLVIDAGYVQTTATPVFEGHALFPLGGNVGKGSASVSVKLVQQIFSENPSFVEQYQQYQ